jgi:hypothetical protein
VNRSLLAFGLVMLGLVGCPGEDPTPPPVAPPAPAPTPTPQPPVADPAPPPPPPSPSSGEAAPSGRTLSLCLDHDDPRDTKCAAFAAGKPCADRTHWPFDVKGNNCFDLAHLGAMLQDEVLADREARGLPPPKAGKFAPLSELTVTIYSGPEAPWAQIQMAMNAAAYAGIYKIEWCACSIAEERASIKAGKGIDRPAPIKVWLPRSSARIVDEIRVIVDFNPATGTVTRRVGARETADDAELVATVKASYAEGTFIIIDAPGYAPFGEVLHVVELCKKNGLSSLEFAQPPAPAPDRK